jgi:hypothetical protein
VNRQALVLIGSLAGIKLGSSIKPDLAELL